MLVTYIHGGEVVIQESENRTPYADEEIIKYIPKIVEALA
jgi:hypothetical protein